MRIPMIISNENLQSRSGKSQFGKQYEFKWQDALCELPTGERRILNVQYVDGTVPLKAGKYQLDLDKLVKFEETYGQNILTLKRLTNVELEYVSAK